VQLSNQGIRDVTASQGQLRINVNRRRGARADALRAERLLAAISEGSSAAIVELSLDGEILGWRAAAELIYGRTAAEAIGSSVALLVPPEDRAELMGAVARAARGERVGDLAIAHQHKDGSHVEASLALAPVRDDAGMIVAVLAIARDVSDRRRREQVLRESESRFRSAFDDAAVGMWIVSPAGRILRANRAVCELLGYTAEELEQMDVFAITHEDDLDESRKNVERLLAGTVSTFQAEKQYRRKDGSAVWAHIGVSAVADDGGATMYCVSQIQDISAARAAQQALEASEATFRRLVENTRDVVLRFRLTPPQAFEYVSPSAAAVFGHSPEEFYARPELALESIHPDDRATLQESFDRDPEAPVTLRIVKKDGTVAWIERRQVLVRDDAGVPIALEAIARDVTERIASDEDLAQTQKLEAVGRLAGGIAHDFNNLLTAINGYSDLALGEIDPEHESLRTSVERIRQAGQRASELTLQLLAFSRKQLLQPEVVDLNEIVTEYGALLERLIGDDIEIEIVHDPAIGMVRADPGQLGQVILNLALNSRDAMADGGLLSIETRNVELVDPLASPGLAPGPYVALRIADTGAGMSEEVQQHVFEPFFTTKGPGEGTGLGLATVLGIVQQSDGRITLRSDVGRGTVFEVLLPRVDAVPIRRELPDAGVVNSGSERVLLVEDNETVRGLVEVMLRHRGYTVTAAALPREALALVDECGPFDVVVTDVVMPQMNGGKLVELLQEKQPGIGVLYTSGYTGDAMVARGVLTPGVAFLQKPFTLSQLAGRMREVIEASSNAESSSLPHKVPLELVATPGEEAA